MPLPSTPIEVGGEYKVKSKFSTLDLALTGKLLKVNDAEAEFSLVGSMGSKRGAERYEFDIKSAFDQDRGLFTSIRMDVVQDGRADGKNKYWVALRLLQSK